LIANLKHVASESEKTLLHKNIWIRFISWWFSTLVVLLIGFLIARLFITFKFEDPAVVVAVVTVPIGAAIAALAVVARGRYIGGE
jgi:biotin transporter BioY